MINFSGRAFLKTGPVALEVYLISHEEKKKKERSKMSAN